MACVSAVALVLLGLVSRRSSHIPVSPNFASSPNAAEDSTAAMSVEVQHSYGSEDKMYLYPWEYTAEPYRKSVMQVTDLSNSLLEEGVYFR